MASARWSWVPSRRLREVRGVKGPSVDSGRLGMKGSLEIESLGLRLASRTDGGSIRGGGDTRLTTVSETGGSGITTGPSIDLSDDTLDMVAPVQSLWKGHP